MRFYKNLRFMFRFIWKHNKYWLFLCVIATVLGAITPLANIIIPKYIVDSVFLDADFQQGMLWATLLVCINLVAKNVLALVNYAAGKQKNKLFLSFNIYISELIMNMEYKDLENPKVLDMKERAMKSAFSGGRGFCGSVEVFFSIITNVVVFIGATLKVIELSPYLIPVILAIVILNAIFNSKINKANYKLDNEKAPVERKNSYVFNLISDFSIGKEVRMYNLDQYIINKYKNTSEESNEFYNKAFFNNAKNTVFSNTTASVQLLAVYFLLLFQVFKNDRFTFGDFTVQFTAVNTLSSSLLAIVASILDINQMGFYIDDLEQFIRLPKMDKDKGQSIPELPVYDIDFVDVSFKYPGTNDYALKNVNIHFSTNQKLSFVGLNGAGKTTFIKLLLRLYNVTSGEILLNGKNIQTYKFSEYIRLFSSVFQDYTLFAFSVKENIALSETDFDETKLKRAICESGVTDFIKTKNKGLDSSVFKIFDEEGFEPSGGEGQKIAIARALYKDAKFVVLDEPTSALDPIAEYSLYESIQNLVNDKGCLFISHRLSSTTLADVVFVFSNGEIVEQGSHNELIRIDNGLYKEMFEKQSSYYREG